MQQFGDENNQILQKNTFEIDNIWKQTFNLNVK